MSAVGNSERIEVIVEPGPVSVPANEKARLLDSQDKFLRAYHNVKQVSKVLFGAFVGWSVSYWIGMALSSNDKGIAVGFSILGACGGGYLAMKFWVKELD